MRYLINFMRNARMVLWCLIFLTLSDFIALVRSQRTTGFISIDCGLTGETSYTNSYTGLKYVSDDQYIDTGVNHKISTKYSTDEYVDQETWKDLLTVRSFPDGIKNCYTLNSLTKGSKYLIRASFLHGGYDNSNHGPTFDLYLGVNIWATVTPTVPEYYYYYEIIAIAPTDCLQVCLINTGQGNPFISSLELRPLSRTLYPQANETQSLALDGRCNYGTTSLVRFPDDSHDRIWLNCTDPLYSTISTTSVVQNVENDLFEVPSSVMQSAMIGTYLEPTIDISWYLTQADSTATYLIILDFSEIGKLASKDVRAFDLFFNDAKLTRKPFTPDSFSDALYFQETGNWYNISLRRTSSSTLPPIVNAYEVFAIQPITLVPTFSGDVSAINAIKAAYKVNKGWNGDPCVPSDLTWPGLNCSSSSSSSNPPRITTINLSSSGLTGPIVSQFGNLNALKYLDLSKNKLSGSIPSFLDNLTALVFLDLSGNKLDGSIPPGLEQREKQGLLTVKIGSGSGSGASTKKKTTIVIVIIVVVVLLLLAAIICVLVLCLKRRNNRNVITPQNTQYQEPKPVSNIPNIPSEGYPNVRQGNLDFDNRNFSYKEILMITNNLQNRIGSGGFGSVFVGRLENNKEVAVKLRSQESNQGEREFLAEAQSLTRVHHRNLVSLVGYCMDGNHMALVYEYMSEGTLQDKLRDNPRPLSWKQRLRIAHESAQGLEYLHKSCNPPLIHRDVKSNNILLNANYEAKIADFGLVRAFGGDDAHVSTRIVGTPGYLDPDYYNTSQLSERSDVFSFGVVLLEIITGQPPILGGPQGGHLTQLVQQRLSKGNIESIVDPKMHGQYDLNSVWKVVTLALRCTDKAINRPNMSTVVAELSESMNLESSSREPHSMASESTSQYNYSRNDNFISDVSQGSTFEMGYMGGIPAADIGPQAR